MALKSENTRNYLNQRLLAYAAVLPALAAAGAGTAGAATIVDFTGPYAFGNWTQSVGGNGGITDGTPAGVTLDGSSTLPTEPAEPMVVDVDFTIAAVGTGTVSFRWDWFNSDYIPSFDVGQWLLNGATTDLSYVVGPAGGSSSFSVTAGDIIGFRVRSFDDCCGPAHLTITQFRAPGGEIPEPSTISLMALGVAGLLLARRRREKA